MRTLTVQAPGQLRWTEKSEPRLAGPGAALVRPVAVATCDFDHLIVAGRAPVPLPVEIGHEVVAEVVAVGEDVRGFRAGDRVVVSFQICCGGCAQCRRGRTSCCERVPWLSCYGLGPAAGDWGGAIADLLAVPYADAMLVTVPDEVPVGLAAAAGCNITDAYRCVAPQLAAEPGAPVLIVTDGFQNIGLACAVLALGLGAERVDVLGLSEARAAKASALGARVLDSTGDVEPHEYPITVDASLDEDKLAAALRGTAPGGVCTISAIYAKPVTPVPLLDLFATCATVQTGQPHVRHQLPDVLALLASQRVRTDGLIDSIHHWDDAIDAYADDDGKAVIARPSEAGLSRISRPRSP
jgi:threonine dehydrogenase-like Zn-dependent dehydrogenase